MLAPVASGALANEAGYRRSFSELGDSLAVQYLCKKPALSSGHAGRTVCDAAPEAMWQEVQEMVVDMNE
jgi:hypothetical protein